MKKILNVSIVLYKPDRTKIISIVNYLLKIECINRIFLIDNSPVADEKLKALAVNYIFNEKNYGFGTGHNIALRYSVNEDTKYHLVLNPDIDFRTGTNVLEELTGYLEKNSEVGIIMPKILNCDGSVQLLPKLLPYPLDLFIRTLPFLDKIWVKRKRLYVMQDYQDSILNIPIISGCFSIFNIKAIREIGFYDEKFFMYFEDFDISRRMHRKYKTIFYPKVSVIHLYERGAAKSFRLFWYFMSSAISYFNKYGWIFDKERKKINDSVLRNIALAINGNVEKKIYEF